MALHRHDLLSFLLIVMISFVACYSTLQDNALSLYVEEDSPYIDDGGAFNEFIKKNTDVLSLKGSDKLGGTFLSLKTVNFNDYGAKGDGRTDDTLALKKAWQAACSSGGARLVVPQKNYLLKPVRFSGPYKSNIVVQLEHIGQAKRFHQLG